MRTALQSHLAPVVKLCGIDPLTVIALVNLLLSTWKACKDDNAQEMAFRLQNPRPIERQRVSGKCRRYLASYRGDESDRHRLTAAIFAFFAAQDRQSLATELRTVRDSED